jgi:hypothetical protein
MWSAHSLYQIRCKAAQRIFATAANGLTNR